MYATCTFANEENEAQIAWLRENLSNAWEAVHDSDLDAWRSPLLDGCYRLWPHRDRCSGGFAACSENWNLRQTTLMRYIPNFQ